MKPQCRYCPASLVFRESKPRFLRLNTSQKATYYITPLMISSCFAALRCQISVLAEVTQTQRPLRFSCRVLCKSH